MTGTPHVARVRHENAVALLDDFVDNTVKRPDAATPRTLKRRFSERIQTRPSC